MKVILFSLFVLLASNFLFPRISLGQEKSVNELCKNANGSTEQIEVFTNMVPANSRRARILTPGGSAVRNAIIVVSIGNSDDPVWSGETSDDGDFEFPTLESGRYSLTICKQGYNPARFTIAIPKRFKSQRAVVFRVSPS